MMRYFTLLLIILSVAGCTMDFSMPSSKGSFSVSGSLKLNSFSNISSQNVCAGEIVHLYSLDANGETDQLIATTELGADGKYEIKNLQEVGLSSVSEAEVGYIVEMTCNNQVYQRYLTDNTEQDLSESYNILAWLQQSGAKSKIRDHNGEDLTKFYQEIGDTDSITEAFSTLINNDLLRDQFIAMFGIHPSALERVPPRVRTLKIPSQCDEGSSVMFSANVFHWSASYQVAMSWRIDGVQVATSNNYTYYPGSNDQGPRNIQLIVGAEDEGGSLDTSQPYLQRSITLQVKNTHPAVAPILSLLSATETNQTTVNLQMNTGGLIDGKPLNCHTFSKLALVERDVADAGIPPLNASAYNIDCDTAVQQGLDFSLSGTEGVRSLNLWARDASGKISKSSSSVQVTYDVTAPSFNSLGFLQSSPVGTPFVNIVSTANDNLSANIEIQAQDGVSLSDPGSWAPYSTDLPKTFNFIQGNHDIYVFLRDGAGNETSQVLSIQLDSGTPPQVAILGPPLGTLLSDPANLSLHIHDNETSMPSDGVDLHYSDDNGQSWNLIAENLSTTSNDSNMAVETLAYTWTPVPAGISGKAIRFRVTARDAAGNTVSYKSGIYNVSGLRVLAGGIADGNNVSARFTRFNTQTYFRYDKLSSFVRDPFTNDYFVGDNIQGLRWINGATGVVKLAPLANGEAITNVDRDNFGKVYGCNNQGIFTWDSTTEAWNQILPNSCDRLGVWRSENNLFYFTNNNRLYYYDGSSVSHVAFDGTIQSTSSTCYSFDPGDPLLSCFPKGSSNFAVSRNGDAYFGDNCPWHGNATGCNARYVYYQRSTEKLHFQDFVSNETDANIFFRYYDDSLINVAMGLYDEDPVTGNMFFYGHKGLIRQFPQNFTMRTSNHSWGSPANDAEAIATIAGVTEDAGDGGPALQAHLNRPEHVVVGHPAAPDADDLSIPYGLGCCWAWGQGLRIIEALTEVITRKPGGNPTYSRNPSNNIWAPSPAGGVISFFSRTHFLPDGTQYPVLAGTSTCDISPTDGVNAQSNNWPRDRSWYHNYFSGLHHTDGYVYVQGFRNTVFDANDCSGAADFYIKRFSYDGAGTSGVVEHVAGTAGPGVPTPVDATGQLAQSFSFSGRVGTMKENLSPGGGNEIYFISDGRIRFIKRVNPADPSTWTIHDATQDLAGVKNFALNSNINSDATSGIIYYVNGDSNIYRYHLGSGVVGDLSDDTIDSVDLGQINNFEINDIGIRSNGNLIFSDGQDNGTIFEYTP